MKKYLLLMLSAQIMTACTPVKPLTALQLKDKIKAEITVSDDSLDTIAKVETRTIGGGILLRAFIVKKSGVTVYQLYDEIFDATARTWPNFYSVNYEGIDGLHTVDTQLVNNHVVCGQYNCDFHETIAAIIDDQTIKSIADKYNQPGCLWRAKVMARHAPDAIITVNCAVVAALYERTKEHKSKYNF